MNNKIHISHLVTKYIRGEATNEEVDLLHQYYELFDDAPNITDILSKTALHEKEEKGILQLQKHISPTRVQAPKLLFNNWLFRVAVVIAITWGIYTFITWSQTEATSKVLVDITKQKVDYNRFLSLPDGTTVILHSNSTLTYNNQFNSSKREVHLTGEAFFDVAHNEKIPFIIYTSGIKTTVLGTAFNIKAWPNQSEIVVSVARGSVKVEGENNLNIVLSQNNQITYDKEEKIALPMIESIDSTIHWVQTDMIFDNMPFSKLVDHLSKRYNVQFTFENDSLEDCSFTGKFTGTEDLVEILNILTEISGTHYLINHNTVVIKGNSCS